MAAKKTSGRKSAELRDLEERAQELALLLTPKEFGFCIDYLKDAGTIVEAYRRNYKASAKQGRTPSGKSKANNADYANARKVFDSPHVAEYLSTMRMLSATEATLSVQEKREACAQAVRMEWAKLTDANGNISAAKIRKLPASIVKSIRRSLSKWGESIEVELISAIDAMRLDNELAGHNKPVVHDATPELVDAIFSLIQPTSGLHTKHEN